MVCDDVKRVAYFFLDGSLGEPKRKDFAEHLERCRNCDDRIVIHRRLRNFVQKRVERLAAPQNFRERLSAALVTARGEAL